MTETFLQRINKIHSDLSSVRKMLDGLDDLSASSKPEEALVILLKESVVQADRASFLLGNAQDCCG